MRFMLRTIAFSSVLCLGCGSGAYLLAQDNTPSANASSSQDQTGQQMHRGGPRGPMSPDQELSHLTKALVLTSDQQAQIKPILQDRHDQLMQTHQDASMSRQDKMTKMRSADDSANSKLEAVLTSEQKSKYEKMVADRKEHMREMRETHQHGGDPDASGSQPQ